MYLCKTVFIFSTSVFLHTDCQFQLHKGLVTRGANGSITPGKVAPEKPPRRLLTS